MSNEELAQRARTDQAALLELWQCCEGYIYRLVTPYRGQIEEADAMQEAFLAMCSAVNHYNPEAGKTFLSYLTDWTEGRLRRYIAQGSGIAINKHSLVNKYRRTVAEYEEEHGREPSDTEAAELLNISPEALEDLKAASIADIPASLDAVIMNEDGEALTLADTVPGTNDTEAEAVESEYRAELSETMWKTVDTLPQDQADTLRKRYRDGLTLREIGETQGRTVNQAADCERRALVEMRKPRRARKLKPFCDSEIFTRATHGEGVNRFNMTWESATERTALKMYERETEESAEG